jgi:hypothetical protein
MKKNSSVIDVKWKFLGLVLIVSLLIPSAGKTEMINGCSLKGPLLYHPFTLRIPEPKGDTLPPGKNVLFLIAIFDTGSSFVLINNVPYAIRDQDQIKKILPSAADLLDICGPTPVPRNESPTCPMPTGNPPRVSRLINLDVRVWGLEKFVQGQGVPIDHPQAEVNNIRVRPDDFRTDYFAGALIGAPVANRVITYIDFNRVVSRVLFNRTLKAPDMRFYPQGDSSIPTPRYEIKLERFPAQPYGPSKRDQATRGQRYFVQNIVFANNGRSISNYRPSSPSGGQLKVLFDTGTTTTQITKTLAMDLGINTNLPCNKPQCTRFRTRTVGGGISKVLCYEIDRFEMISKNKSYRYVINKPKVCVNPSGMNNSFAGGSQAIIGTNYFENTKILLNGPKNTLGMFVGIPMK